MACSSACYATGTFSSGNIEILTLDSVAVRYLCAQHNPDHDSICYYSLEAIERVEG